MKTLLSISLSLLLSASLFVSINCNASDEWTTSEKLLEAGYITALFIDVGQTHDLVRRGGKEKNPFLGDNPSISKINAAGIIYASGHYIISDKLNARWRRVWQVSTFLIQMDNINHNKQIGMRFNF